MDAYDNNHDGRIDIRELAQLLPLEESFKLLFKFENQVESSVEFMRVSGFLGSAFTRGAAPLELAKGAHANTLPSSKTRRALVGANHST